jgi:hypothetical protein
MSTMLFPKDTFELLTRFDTLTDSVCWNWQRMTMASRGMPIRENFKAENFGILSPNF